MTTFTVSIYCQAGYAETIVAATPQQAAQKYRRLMWRMDKDVTVQVTASDVVNDVFVKGATYVQTGDRRVCRPI